MVNHNDAYTYLVFCCDNCLDNLMKEKVARGVGFKCDNWRVAGKDEVWYVTVVPLKGKAGWCGYCFQAPIKECPEHGGNA